MKNLHQKAFQKLFRGQSESQIKQWANEFLDKYLNHLIYQPAFDELKRAQNAGHLTVILSSSPDFLVESVAKRLGVSLWDATKYEIDKDRCFCNISRIMLGQNKAQFIKNLRKNRRAKQIVTAYSDSDLDLPFLLAADIPIGVNPNRRLRSICRDNHWVIL